MPDEERKAVISLLNIPWNDVLFVYLLPLLNWKDLFRLRRVSSEVLCLVTEYFRSCQSIDLSIVSGQFNAKAFQIISMNNSYIQFLILRNCKWLNSDLLTPVLKTNESIVHLDISGCSALTNLNLQILATKCRGLKKLSLQNCHWVSATAIMSLALECKNLEYVDLTSCWEVTDESVCKLVANCP
ncbi:F-box/LRR-repeat protein 15-like, partial [Centruroides sculpturatus]